MTIQQIADAMGIHRKTVSRHVQEMEEQKLIERVAGARKALGECMSISDPCFDPQ